MRVNSYNKFFTEVAKIMNTEVKSVKQIDGRYKVELANHVYLNVYRGVSGSLFIHDHRGVSHITSCYDFDDFKTMKDLYERLISDYSESTNAETVTQTSEETDKTEYCESTNNDIKGHMYVDTDSVKVAPLPEQQTSEESIKDTIMTDDCIQTVRTMAKNEKIEWALVQYVKAKIDNCYLVNGLQSSFYSKTYGYNKSRSYTKTFFI